jgi:hypothetical protein
VAWTHLLAMWFRPKRIIQICKMGHI